MDNTFALQSFITRAAPVDADRFTDQEIEEFKHAFAFCDKDGDGKVSVDELGQTLRSLGQNPTISQVEAMIARVDYSNDGEINFDEFLVLMADHKSKSLSKLLHHGPMTVLSCIAFCGHVVSYPFVAACTCCCRQLCCASRFEASSDLPEDSELGSRDTALRSLGACARLVGGTGYIDEEYYYKFDPPLNGKYNGWKILSPTDQVCETKGSQWSIQAACYTNEKYPNAAIVAFRGTSSLKGLWQDATLLVPHRGTPIHHACKQAHRFVEFCQERHPEKEFFVTGHSLGGYFAEVVASKMNLMGASFNNPGPWAPPGHYVKNNTGHERPEFEIHLTRSDPLALVLFPKPQHSRHLGRPKWHFGKDHRICDPYVPDEVAGIPTGLQNEDQCCEQIDQWEALGLNEDSSDDSSDSSEDSSRYACC